jgi:dephospho-CoA kinase
MRTPLQVGLTGGIGSGKSTVAKMLQAMGAALIDADAMSRQCTSANGDAIPLIQKTFGTELIALDGALNRKAMRELVFHDPSARQKLEAIVHPLVSMEIQTQIQAALAAGVPCIVIDIPLLTESKHWRAKLDLVVIVDCTEDTQRERVSMRDHLDMATITSVMQAQSTRLHRVHCADIVLYNDGITHETLEGKVKELAHQFGL